ncbi:MAG: PP2C family protein-serine/threonine phosphatase, partial [Planctomycetia bacterium]
MSPRLRIHVGKCTSIGNFRDNNEDRFFVDEEHGVFIVADGMGGQAAGEQASQIAVDLIPQHLLRLPANGQVESAQVEQAVRKAVIAANESIIHQGEEDPSTQNLGTTVVVAVVRGRKLVVAHLGDSRAYRYRNGALEAITVDHNLAQA